jgi:hypothetical protein
METIWGILAKKTGFKITKIVVDFPRKELIYLLK